MIPIPIGKHYTASVTGSAWKPVNCMFCECKYVYLIKRNAEGSAMSFLFLDNTGASNQSRDRAYNELDSKIENEIEAVSCPNCGMYQKNMVRKLKLDAWRSVIRVATWFGILGAVIGLISFVVIRSFFNSLIWLQLVVILLILGFWIWAVLRMCVRAAMLDPNTNAFKRKGQSFSENYPALLMSEFEELRKQA